MSHSDPQPIAVHGTERYCLVWPLQGRKSGYFKGTAALFHPAHLWVQIMNVPSLPIEQVEFYRYS